MHANTRRVAEVAAAAGLDLDVHTFPAGTRTAADAAAAIGCDLAAIAKSIVLTADDGAVVVLTSGAHRVDYTKVARALGVATVRRADAEEARAATGYPIGGTAPWGYPQPVPVLCDPHLLTYDVVWAAGGTPDTVFPITPDELLRIAGARTADVAEDPSAPA
ncbi:MAG TPA: YbaK/EbsC family protein [Egibacteraceae bacterium]|nr:YbaK/EbsC family protein [Egibacteraceae bacterium]